MPYVPNSSTAGFLGSISNIPNDQALEDALNPTIAGITQLDKDTQIRPRFQEDPPAVPDRNTNWVAFGIVRILSDTCAATVQQSATSALVIRNQEIEVLLSWYGPQAGNYAEVFRDGLQIDQNRDLLNANELGIISIGEARKAPEMFKQKYLNRWDMTLMLRRRTARQFSILTLAGFGITLHTDPVGETPIQINYAP